MEGSTITNQLVSTLKERCRVCYTCVRECPAKAIRISGGQAEVIAERCIGCGNCYKVCSQGAKVLKDTTREVVDLLGARVEVIAMLAPSFPADFPSTDHRKLAGALHALGFSRVVEVAAGADIVARGYVSLLEQNGHKNYIATTCPAIVEYVRRYQPELLDSLAPLVSPMVATARAVRKLYGPEVKTVFIGPCLAKKAEESSNGHPREVDGVITFEELRHLFARFDVVPELVRPFDFDPPEAGLGAVFPISRGLLQTAKLTEDLTGCEVIVADGHANFIEALREFRSGDLRAHLLETLCCNGCIMGPGVASDAPLFRRRARVSRYVNQRMMERAGGPEPEIMPELQDLDLTRTYQAFDQRIAVPSEDEVLQILARMGKATGLDELNCGACGYPTCREHAVAIFKGLAESEMCLPYSIDRLRSTVNELAQSNQALADTREALRNSEKLASMGQLAAGVAHEVNNPLGVVLMYSHLVLDALPEDSAMREDLCMIAEQADRCRKIVAGLLGFARQNKTVLAETNMPGLVEHAAQLAMAPPEIKIELVNRMSDPLAWVDGDQLTQVLTNLVSNSIAAMPGGGTITLETGEQGARVLILVRDTGTGIPEENMAKIFEPFFTTKTQGKGTGLGLAVSYGIIKMHRGDIRVASNADPAKGPTGTTFTLTLPRYRQEQENDNNAVGDSNDR